MRERRAYRWCLLLMLVAGGLVFQGCATSGEESYSERPWNSPRGWEHGMPAPVTEGR